MNALTLSLDPKISPLYLRIADAFRQAVKSGNLVVGESLPSSRRLANELNTNRHTVMAALQELVAQGWVESLERKGYRVATTLPIDESHRVSERTAQAPQAFQWSIPPNIAALKPELPAHEHEFNFAGGMPDISLFPFDELKSYIRDTLSRPDTRDLNYGNHQGNRSFIQQAETYLRRVRGVTEKELLVVNGSQEALYLVAQVLLQPGDKVAVEALGYRPAWDAFRTTGAELVGIQQHEKGIDVDHLERLFATEPVKLIYLTPLHQYPTTITLPIHERMAIYRLAAKHNVAIIEDDYDHEFHYDSQPLTPMAADDPHGLVIYLSTFSKILFPGCRIGLMAVDKTLMPYLLNFRRLMNHKPNFLLQDALGRWMKEGGFERHLRKTTRRYHQRRDHLVSLISQLKQRGLPIDCQVPSGGMALWLDIKQGARSLQDYCRKRDIYLVAEQQFHLTPEHNQDRFIRLGYAGMTEERLSLGLASIARFWPTPAWKPKSSAGELQ